MKSNEGLAGRARLRRAEETDLWNRRLRSLSFDFGHREPHARLRARLGGKGFSLWLMRHELDLPVPPGFTIETGQCQPYFANGLREPSKRAIRSADGRLERESAGGLATEPIRCSSACARAPPRRCRA